MFWSRNFGTHPLIIHMMQTRGIQSEEHMTSFLFSDKSQLLDPFLLPDMKQVIKIIINSLRSNKKMGIFGDYDVDGMTSTAILVKALRFFGADVVFKVPLRDEGYGLTPAAVKDFHEQGVALLITVDNGSTALEAARLAKSLGMELLITDHHQLLPSGEHPPCDGFVNHQRKDGVPYPFPHLCGAAIAYKIVEALFSTSRFPWCEYMQEYTEMVALGTIADMMPLVEENRILARLGLQKMQTSPTAPFALLFESLKLAPKHVTSSEIGFRIAPIFNASGRIADPNVAVRFLLGDCADIETVNMLLTFNEERKTLTREQTLLAEDIIYNSGFENNPIMVVQGDFHEGVMGIVASRVSDAFSRPAIILADNYKGSARSGPHDFSIIEAITSCSEHLLRFGGHKAAAGLAVKPEAMDQFALDIQKTFTLQDAYVRSYEYDLALPMESFPYSLCSELRLLEPFGMANPQPCFYSPRTPVQQVISFGKNQEHLKFMVEGNEALLFSGNKKREIPQNATQFGFLYTPSAKGRLQFMIQDLNAC